MTSRVFPPLDDHFPAPAGDPNYVPWWAKGEYARRNATSYTTESGVSVSNGAVVGKRLEDTPDATTVPEPQPTTAKRTGTPKKATSAPSKLDAGRLHSLAKSFGLRDDIWKESPNMGVAVMRIRNAARRKGLAT